MDVTLKMSGQVWCSRAFTQQHPPACFADGVSVIHQNILVIFPQSPNSPIQWLNRFCLWKMFLLKVSGLLPGLGPLCVEYLMFRRGDVGSVLPRRWLDFFRISDVNYVTFCDIQWVFKTLQLTHRDIHDRDSSWDLFFNQNTTCFLRPYEIQCSIYVCEEWHEVSLTGAGTIKLIAVVMLKADSLFSGCKWHSNWQLGI